MLAINTSTIRRVICLAESMTSFVLACLAAPNLHCYYSKLEPFGYCGTLALVFSVLSLAFLIPGLILWFHAKVGAVFQLFIVIAVAWVILNYA